MTDNALLKGRYHNYLDVVNCTNSYLPREEDFMQIGIILPLCDQLHSNADANPYSVK